MSHEFSKENQSSIETAYRFGDFELSARDRLLKRDGTAIPLQPKAFDALLCLVLRAKHLVSKRELVHMLWPHVHVSEANLTNVIVSLRKAVGRDSIRTVSKHGYRFELPVTGEPGIARSTYERFVRARELTTQRSIQSMMLARELYWTCLAENPDFAPGWAWLGRCCWFLGKFNIDPGANLDLARAALQRAFVLDADLASAHQFYTHIQTDMGRATQAMIRLSDRLEQHPGEPESLSGLVQVLRFCGLLPESIRVHQQAAEMDCAVVTSVAHSLFLSGNFAAAIEHYGGRGAFYLDAAAWAALGEPKRAITLLQDRLNRLPLSPLMSALMSSLLALLEGRNDEAIQLMESADATYDPEILVYFARHYARMGVADAAVHAIERAAISGFRCSADTLRLDPWLDAVRQHGEFKALLSAAEDEVLQHKAILTPLHRSLERGG
jgi:DNA-binding winged helix-turn-helix (wHTH) protein